jgi:hypothetical protein
MKCLLLDVANFILLFQKNGLKYPLKYFLNFIFEKKKLFLPSCKVLPPQKNTGV